MIPLDFTFFFFYFFFLPALQIPSFPLMSFFLLSSLSLLLVYEDGCRFCSFYLLSHMCCLFFFFSLSFPLIFPTVLSQDSFAFGPT